MPEQLGNFASVGIDGVRHEVVVVKNIEVLNLPRIGDRIGDFVVVVDNVVDGVVTHTTGAIFRIAVVVHDNTHVSSDTACGHVAVAVKVDLILNGVGLCGAVVVVVGHLIPSGGEERLHFTHDVVVGGVAGGGVVAEELPLFDRLHVGGAFYAGNVSLVVVQKVRTDFGFELVFQRIGKHRGGSVGGRHDDETTVTDAENIVQRLVVFVTGSLLQNEVGFRNRSRRTDRCDKVLGNRLGLLHCDDIVCKGKHEQTAEKNR